MSIKSRLAKLESEAEKQAPSLKVVFIDREDWYGIPVDPEPIPPDALVVRIVHDPNFYGNRAAIDSGIAARAAKAAANPSDSHAGGK